MQKAATTWLYEISHRHPEIAMAAPVTPEPKFFSVDELYERGLEFYSKTWFEGLPERAVLGEKSAIYLESRVAAGRITRDLPMAKVVFILRNPVDRAYSNYLYTKRSGLETETFERALELEATREELLRGRWRYARPFSYFSRGLYAELLAPWLELFQREQLLILKTEDIAQKPEAVASRLYRFVGVCEYINVTNGLGLVNAAEDEWPPMEPEVREKLVRLYAGANQALRNLLGSTFDYADPLNCLRVGSPERGHGNAQTPSK